MVERLWRRAIPVLPLFWWGCGRVVETGNGGSGGGLPAPPGGYPDRVGCDYYCQERERRWHCGLEGCENSCTPAVQQKYAQCQELAEQWYACLLRNNDECVSGCPGPIGEGYEACLIAIDASTVSATSSSVGSTTGAGGSGP